MKAFKLFLLIFFISAIFFQSIAQRIITGTITDNNAASVNNSLVEIINANDTSLIYSDYTDDNGFYEISANIVGIKANNPITPSEFLELRNYPNPFNPSTIIYFKLPKADFIDISIYDILGRQVKSLYNNFHNGGIGTIHWDGDNNQGVHVAAGIYFCMLKTKSSFLAHKMLLLDGGSIFHTNQSLNKSSAVNKPNNSYSEPFLFKMRISGQTFATREIDSLICWQDTTIDVQLNRIVSRTIGTSGGKIEADGFELTIPPGAFGSDYTVSVHQSYYGNPFGEYGASESFVINGMPSTLTLPLQLKMRHNGSLLNSTYITVGEKTYVPDVRNNLIYYKFFECTESSDYVYAEVDPFHTTSTLLLNKTHEPKLPDGSLSCHVTTNYVGRDDEDERITIFGGIDNFNQIKTILNMAMNNIYSLGFDQLEEYCSDINVIAKPNRNSGISSYPIALKKYRYGIVMFIIIESDIIDDPLLSANVHSSLFSSIQGKYSVLNYFTFEKDNINDGKRNLWLHQAVNRWASTISGSYPPLRFLAKASAPLYSFGLTPNNEDYEWHVDYGFGLSSLIFYLDDLNLNNSDHIVDFYKYISENNPECHIKGLINSLEENLSLSVNQWYPDYINKYLLGQVFNFNTSELTENISSQWDISSKDDTLHTFEEDYEINYNDISSKIFQINCNFQDITPDNELHIRTISNDVSADHIKLFVYEHSNNSFNLLAESDGSAIGLTNIEPLFDEQKSLYCVVVNSLYGEPHFDGKNEIVLEAELIGTQDTSFNYASIFVNGINANFSLKGTYYSSDTGVINEHVVAQVTKSDSSYIGSWEGSAGFYNHYGNLEIVMNSNNEVSKIIINQQIIYGPTASRTYEIVGMGGPIKFDEIREQYYLQGSAVCDFITNYSFEEQANETSSRTMTSHSCDANSVIAVSLWNE